MKPETVVNVIIAAVGTGIALAVALVSLWLAIFALGHIF